MKINLLETWEGRQGQQKVCVRSVYHMLNTANPDQLEDFFFFFLGGGGGENFFKCIINFV